MGFIENFIRMLPLYLLSLPVVLMALSVHESAHGYVACKLGDPTARNLGRITLNPIKHIDIFGFLCMLFFRVGWAKPVPITTRNFKNPRRDMALCGAAGPLSNLLLALIHLVILRLVMFVVTPRFSGQSGEVTLFLNTVLVEREAFTGSIGFTLVALIVYMLQTGIVLNIMLAIFNLIPIPPFDGSRIFYAFLPPKWYFGIMKYERFIMIGFLVLFCFGFLSGPLYAIENAIINGLLFITGMKPDTMSFYTQNDAGYTLVCMQRYVEYLFGLWPA